MTCFPAICYILTAECDTFEALDRPSDRLQFLRWRLAGCDRDGIAFVLGTFFSPPFQVNIFNLLFLLDKYLTNVILVFYSKDARFFFGKFNFFFNRYALI